MNSLLFLLFALKTIQLELGGHSIQTELAVNPESRSTGLQNRKHLLEDHGMLFIFEEPSILSFWMKDTLIPLSIGFFDAAQTLLNIEDMYPASDQKSPLALYQSSSFALYALEMPLHWFKDHQVFSGMKFSFQDQPIELK